MRKRIIGMLAVCIIALLPVAAIEDTLAFRMDQTPPLENHFVFLTDGLKATLTEPDWNPDNAVNLVPGSIIKKNPQINNTGVIDEWAALKVTFCYGPDAGVNAGKLLGTADLSKVLAAITIDWNTGSWTRFEDSTSAVTILPTSVSQTFYYQSIVQAADEAAVPIVPAGTTIPLFTRVIINDTNTQAQMAELKAMGGFQIHIEGSVVQSEITAAMTDDIAASAFSFPDTPA